jgi:peroxiredoxin
MSRRRALQRLAGWAAGAVLAGACQRGEDRHEMSDPLPEFALPDLDGALHRRADYLGRPLLVNFWATWCPPCRAEMGDLDILARKLAPRGLQFLAVSVDDDRYLVAEYIRREKLAFTVLLDAGHQWSDKALRVPGFPTTYLVGADGLIRGAWIGARKWAEPSVQAEVATLAGLAG